MLIEMYFFLLIIFLGAQCIPTTNKHSFYTRWLPNFRFFGPAPLSSDIIIYYRALPYSDDCPWISTSPRISTSFAAMWNPFRRSSKAITDMHRQILYTICNKKSPNAEILPIEMKLYILTDPLIRSSASIDVRVYSVGKKTNSEIKVQEIYGCILIKRPDSTNHNSD